MDRAEELLGLWELGGESLSGVRESWLWGRNLALGACLELELGGLVICELEAPRPWALFSQRDFPDFIEQLFNRKFHFYYQVF